MVGGTHTYYTTHHRRLPMHSVKWRRLVRKSSRDVHFFEHHPLTRLNGNEKAYTARVTLFPSYTDPHSPWYLITMEMVGAREAIVGIRNSSRLSFPASRKQSSSIRYFPHSNTQYLRVRHKCCIRNLTAKVAHAQLSLVFLFFRSKVIRFRFQCITRISVGFRGKKKKLVRSEGNPVVCVRQ